ncbi:YetF domain-containing protein [Achromobacter sp. F4_2707]|uniref:DUF421 domain-containing protein n=1 Tax=Achromobacter sp. F4_2707 TaxID=3114286 RepID=UPI0039C677EE
MLTLHAPWWEFIIRGAVVYLALLILVRLTGKRTVGQFTPFDLLVVVLLSEAVGGSMTAGDESLIGGLIVAVTLLSLNVLIAYIASRNRRLENLLEGQEVLLGRNGRLFENVMKAHRIGRNEIDQVLHANDIDLEDMEYVFLETDGSINVTKRK